MAEKKEGDSVLRKMVRFVANPTTDWSELSVRGVETDSQLASREELRAMVERKRRNEFVRRREFDMLRRVRREGLSPEQAAAIDRSSRLDESDIRSGPSASSHRHGVKDKIDAIEQQMVGARGDARQPRDGGMSSPGSAPNEAPTMPIDLAAASTRGGTLEERRPTAAERMADAFPPTAIVPRSPSPAPAPAPRPPAPAPIAEMEVSEIVHDPDLDEVVIAFASADFAMAEEALAALTARDGARYRHADTWLTRFDLYRATGQHDKFDALANDFAHGFGQSAPQWISLPQLVAEDAQGAAAPESDGGEVGWVAPPVLDAEGVGRLESQTMQLPLPWVLDWRALGRIEADGAARLNALLRRWSGQEIQMRWLAAERLMAVLQETTPAGARDSDPGFWLLRMEALRLANRIDQFDEAAIDYCVTFEVSPPSWEPARCTVRLSGSGPTTRAAPMSIVGEAVTSFMESVLGDEGMAQRAVVEVATVELSGQLVGDIHAQLEDMDRRVGQATVVRIACTKLIRADFIAAGDLLNWVVAKRGEGRDITFFDAHRLIAHFFGAMGIVEHARVQPLHA